MTERGARKVHDLVDRLAALGFASDEARIYLHLNEHGPARASDLAQALRLHRPDIYRVVQGLVGRGAVLARAGRPTLFEAAPPEALVREALALRAAALREVEQAQEDLVPALEQARGQAISAGGRPAFRVHHGRLDCARAFERLVRGARREVRLASAAEPARSLLEVAGLPLQPPPGVTVRVLASGDARVLAEAGIAARSADLPLAARFAVADEREALCWLAPGGRGWPEEAALWTDAPGAVAVLAACFQLAWAAGEGLPPVESGHGSVRNA